MPKNTPCNILIVEDSNADFDLLKIALEDVGFEFPIVRCFNGEEAILYLRKHAQSNELPLFMMLDINMPLMGGKEALAIIKSDPKLAAIPVAVLTVSADSRDVDECYTLGANTFISKSADYDDFVDKIRLLKEFWFDVATLPTLEDDVNIVRSYLMPKTG